MNKLLGIDSPFIRFMEHVADFFILNLLTVLCCIPLLTVGAALVAHSKIMQNLVMNEEQPVGKAYFRAFCQNFKQATVFWLAALVLIVLYVVDYFLIRIYFDESLALLTGWLLGILGVVALGVLCYAFPFVARYENTLKEHLRNSFVIAIGDLPRTLLLVLVAAIPLILAVISLELFFTTIILWFTFGISIVLYIQALILRPVFLRLEQSEEEGSLDE